MVVYDRVYNWLRFVSPLYDGATCQWTVPPPRWECRRWLKRVVKRPFHPSFKHIGMKMQYHIRPCHVSLKFNETKKSKRIKSNSTSIFSLLMRKRTIKLSNDTWVFSGLCCHTHDQPNCLIPACKGLENFPSTKMDPQWIFYNVRSVERT